MENNLKTFKKMRLVAVILVSINIILILMVLWAANHKKIVGQLVIEESREGRKMVEAVPFNALSSSDYTDNAVMNLRLVLEEMFVRYYLEKRLTVINDPLYMIHEWYNYGPLAWVSSYDVYEKEALPGNDLGLMRNFLSSLDANQSIVINSMIPKMDKTGDIWTVDADRFYMKGDNVIKQDSLFITITVGYHKSMGNNPFFPNPYGFYVRNLRIAEKGMKLDEVTKSTRQIL